MEKHSHNAPLHRSAIITLIKLAKNPETKEIIHQQGLSQIIKSMKEFRHIEHVYKIARIGVDMFLKYSDNPPPPPSPKYIIPPLQTDTITSNNEIERLRDIIIQKEALILSLQDKLKQKKRKSRPHSTDLISHEDIILPPLSKSRDSQDQDFQELMDSLDKPIRETKSNPEIIELTDSPSTPTQTPVTKRPRSSRKYPTIDPKRDEAEPLKSLRVGVTKSTTHGSPRRIRLKEIKVVKKKKKEEKDEPETEKIHQKFRRRFNDVFTNDNHLKTIEQLKRDNDALRRDIIRLTDDMEKEKKNKKTESTANSNTTNSYEDISKTDTRSRKNFSTT